MSKTNTISNLLYALKSKRMLTILLLGFSSGLPIMLVGSVLKNWLRREGVDISTVGYMSWIMIPYSFNFLWAPVLDRFTISRLGRRRGWILLSQIFLVLGLIGIGLSNPSFSISAMVILGIIVAFFSATQDIAVDAYRREILPDEELGVGAALGVYGYRVAMLVAGGLGLWIVDPETLNFTFNQTYFLMAAFMLIGVCTTFFAQEPEQTENTPQTMIESVFLPFKEFLSREGAIIILLFVLFFKMGDAIAGSMLQPFYVDIGFSNKDIGAIGQGIGFFSTMAGLFLGGSIIYWAGIYRSLWVFGILQAVSTMFFVVLTVTGPQWWALASVVAFEDLSSGMGTAALVAFMGSMANKKFTATQYALLSSLASFGRTFFSGFAGDMILYMGYGSFFIFCSALASLGLILLFFMKKIYHSSSSLKQHDSNSI